MSVVSKLIVKEEPHHQTQHLLESYKVLSLLTSTETRVRLVFFFFVGNSIFEGVEKSDFFPLGALGTRVGTN